MGDFNFLLILPETWLSIAGLVILLAGLVFKKRREGVLITASLCAIAIAAFLVYALARKFGADARSGFAESIVVDPFSSYFKFLFLGSSFLTLLMSRRFLERSSYTGGEFSALILFATVGMMFMASGTDLITLYIGLELMALSTYVLAGYFKGEVKSNEAGLKYFVLGGMSSGVLLYGLSLIYGTSGSTNIAVIAAKLGADPSKLAMLGIVFVSAGLFFKVAAAPFHVWVPDVYEGAPTPVSAFMSVGPKAAAYALLARIFYNGFYASHEKWVGLVALVAAFTMIWGNVAALLQNNVKRMLAYSSIAHAGYALLGVVAFDGKWGLSGVLFYMLAYTFMNLGAFGFVILLETKGYAGETVSDFEGLSKKHPIAAAGMLLFLLSLAGIPPTAGFLAKYVLFAATIKAGYVSLAVIAVISSAISLFYYFRIVAAMYLKEEKEFTETISPTRALSFSLAFCALMTIVVGVAPGPFLEWARASLPAFHR